MTNSGLDVMHIIGDMFTWTNKRIETLVFKRLDRMIANSVWFNTFTEGNVFV